jgi:ubiquinone/menaquinone biosynthesis C-methylase UbiE
LYYKGEKLEVPHSHGCDFHGYGDKIRAELSRRIPKDKEIRVLDIGTGFGSVASFLSKHLSKESKLWTADPSIEMLDGAKAKLVQEGLDKRIPIEFIQAEAARLDFEDCFFDAVVSVMMLHHVEDLNPVLIELLRVLKKDGELLLIDYLPKAGNELEFLMRHHQSDFFDPKTVVKSIEQIGVTKVKLKRAKLWYLVVATK